MNPGPLNSGLKSNGGMTGAVIEDTLDWCVRVDDRLIDRLSGLKMNVEIGEGPIVTVGYFACGNDNNGT